MNTTTAPTTNIQWIDHDHIADNTFREYAEGKLKGLEKLWPHTDETHLRVTRQRAQITVEVTLFSGGLVTRGEEKAENVRMAFDNAFDRIERQLRRYKKKALARKRHQNNRDEAGEIINATVGLPDEGVIEDHEEVTPVRVKRFAVKPMSADEASLHMELLGHSFFVFRHEENQEVNVIYRRADGGYGLIETEVG
ncbi:MAG: ribosome-associated translation inhibitor RaiA [Abditibacteriaceae bacterium]